MRLKNKRQMLILAVGGGSTFYWLEMGYFMLRMLACIANMAAG